MLTASIIVVVLTFICIRRYPRTAVVAEMIAIVANCWALYGISGQTVVFSGLWLFVCAQLTTWAQQFFNNPGKLRAFEWERWIGIALLLIVFFSTFLYGHARCRFGGGATVPVLVHLNEEAGKLFSTNPAPAWLIEETENGFCVLRDPKEKSSLFIPRSAVRALEFNPPAGDAANKSGKAQK